MSAIPGRRLQFPVLIWSTHSVLAPSRWAELNFQQNLSQGELCIPHPPLTSQRFFLPCQDCEDFPKPTSQHLKLQFSAKISQGSVGPGVTKTALSWVSPTTLCRPLPASGFPSVVKVSRESRIYIQLSPILMSTDPTIILPISHPTTELQRPCCLSEDSLI